jgi:hypothetical protein
VEFDEVAVHHPQVADPGAHQRVGEVGAERATALPRTVTSRGAKPQVTDFRLTVIDPLGAVSFVSPAHGAKILTAACSKNPPSFADLFALARPYDTELIDTILDGLAHFDEHNGPGNYRTILDMLDGGGVKVPFRVVDVGTRRASLAPVGSGLVIYNLTAQRIVQVQNSYCNLLRRDRGRIRASGRPTRHLYRYELPGEWQLVP